VWVDVKWGWEWKLRIGEKERRGREEGTKRTKETKERSEIKKRNKETSIAKKNEEKSPKKTEQKKPNLKRNIVLTNLLKNGNHTCRMVMTLNLRAVEKMMPNAWASSFEPCEGVGESKSHLCLLLGLVLGELEVGVAGTPVLLLVLASVRELNAYPKPVHRISTRRNFVAQKRAARTS